MVSECVKRWKELSRNTVISYYHANLAKDRYNEKDLYIGDMPQGLGIVVKCNS